MCIDERGFNRLLGIFEVVVEFLKDDYYDVIEWVGI